jgi:alginate O-acetyltransferase complex protein AlgI
MANQLFLTYWFVLFAAVLYPLYSLVPLRRARLALLLAGSAVFHTHFAGPAGVLPIIVLAVLVYLAGLTRNRAVCAVGIVTSAAALVYYKYTRFLGVALVCAVYPPAEQFFGGSYPLLSPAPPLAISFFTFEFIHYLVDVARGAPPIRNVRNFALFSIFWPSIVAGPVKRYQPFLASLNHGVRSVNSHDAAVGLTRLALGLVKKFAADTLTAWLKYNAPLFATLPVGRRWVFLTYLALRILLDFSGYTDMAIGLARMHGIRLPENFNWPYLARSLTDFWHRWHMSLSSWIRDYIYIALGGSRRGPALKVCNGLLAFAVCGLWHGAGWNFLVWGLYHGVGLAVCSSYRTLLGRPGAAVAAHLQRNAPLSWLLTQLYAWVGWLFFFYPLHQSWPMLKLLFRSHL